MDLADAHIATLNFLLSNSAQYKCINIGTGVGTSVLEVMETFLKFMVKNFPLIILKED